MQECPCDSPRRCKALGACRRDQLRQAAARRADRPAPDAPQVSENVIPFRRKPDATKPPRKG